ncbi:MAG: Tad domain-containing protein [Lautropia sp.]|nr:Tad domain-containing protein [Lautropia sp.]
MYPPIIRATIRGAHAPGRSIPSRHSRRRQRGQALVFGMFMLVVVALLAFFLFSAGQSTAARMRLVNATDAAAYSAGLWRARAMNYYAYANRAIVANEVAIAQATTLVSFARFLQLSVERASRLTGLLAPVGRVLGSIDLASQWGLRLTRYAAAVDVAARSGYNHALAGSQEVIHLMTNAFTLSSIAQEVMGEADGRFHGFVVPPSFMGEAEITRRHEGEARHRLRQVVMESRDGYTKDRGARLEWGCLPRLVRQGQTELVLDHDSSLDRWQAYDTMSVHLPRRLNCRRFRERVPIGWAGAEVASNPTGTLDALNGTAQNPSGQKVDNSRAYRRAARDREFWSNGLYFGLPSVRGLDFDSAALKQNSRFPTMKVAVVGRIRHAGAIATAENRQLGAGRVQPKDNFAGQRTLMMALSMAEIYFRRPPAGDNRVEYASLYSPYWQVRLAPVPLAWREALTGSYLLADRPTR